MLRDYRKEFEDRVAFIRARLADAHAKGVVFGNSGGKDCALVGILCKAACENTLGVLLPCAAKQNYGSDTDDALALARQFGIETRTVDLTAAREAVLAALADSGSEVTDAAVSNIAPRLRMTALYTIAHAEGRLVAGTGNRSERYMGYFTKWGDGAFDFDPIADLTVTEIYEFLDWLDAPAHIREKAPSAGLFDGQTDEAEMGVTYAAIDGFLLRGEADEADRAVIERYHSRAGHKLTPPPLYGAE